MKFKKLTMLMSAAALSVALLIPAVASAAPAGAPDDAARLYKFNIIGVDNPKDVDMTGDNGKRMFVPLNDACKIVLQQAMEEDGETPMPYNAPGAFDIIDANGTDGEAIFQMPAPGLDPYVIGAKGDADVWSDYSIYIRSLGKPGGWASITTCADLQDSTFAGLLSGKFQSVLNREGLFGGYASVEQVGQEITERPKGKSEFTNVTAELTTIVFKVEVELTDGSIVTEYVRVPIFSDILEGEYWEYDCHGLKLLQVWIYDCSTDVSAGDADIVG